MKKILQIILKIITSILRLALCTITMYIIGLYMSIVARAVISEIGHLNIINIVLYALVLLSPLVLAIILVTATILSVKYIVKRVKRTR